MKNKIFFSKNDLKKNTNKSEIFNLNLFLKDKDFSKEPKVNLVFEKTTNNEPKIIFNRILIRMGSKTPKLSLFSKIFFFSLSVFSHFVIFYFFNFIFQNDFEDLQEEQNSVQVAFGLSSNEISKNNDFDVLSVENINSNKIQGEKTLETLPQLPKSFSIDEYKKNNEKEIGLTKSKDFIKENKIVKDTEKKNNLTKPIKLTKEEVLKRAKKDLSKVGSKNINGDPFATLPPSKITSSSSLSKVPVGAIDGRLLNSIEAQYTALLQAHIQEQWSLSPEESFDENLSLTVQINLNSSGFIVGKPTVLKSSGNVQFDNLALKAIIIAQPFPPIPIEISDNIKTITLMNIQPTSKVLK